MEAFVRKRECVTLCLLFVSGRAGRDVRWEHGEGHVVVAS